MADELAAAYLTDTHCHLDLDQFDQDSLEVIRRAIEAGVGRILIPSLTVASSRTAVQLSDTHPLLYAAIGVHPNEAESWDGQTTPSLREIVANSLKVAAMGEIGLDYYWDASPHNIQIAILKEQLALASELELPVVLHSREKNDAETGQCTEDLFSILNDWVAGLRSSNSPLMGRPGVLHSFSGTKETAIQAIHLGFFIGVTGPVTFKNAIRRQEIIASLPVDRLLIETDAPFLAPHPHRGKRNEPAFVAHIADKIAQIQSRTPQEVAAVTTANAARLFSWGETV